MSINKRIQSGSKLGTNIPPIERFVVGSAGGGPDEIHIYKGKLFVYDDTGNTLISGGVITTHAIHAHTIVATQLNVVSINASGTINATYITTGTLSVGGTGDVSPADLIFLDSTDAEYGKVNYLGLIFLNEKGVFLHNVGQAGNPGLFYMDASDVLWLRAGLDDKIKFAAQDNTLAYTFDTSTGIIQCNLKGSYYLIGAVASGGSVVLKSAGAFWGAGGNIVETTYTYGATLTGNSLSSGVGLGKIVPINSFDSGISNLYAFSTTDGGAVNEMYAQQFTMGGTGRSIDALSVTMSKTGTPAGTMVAEFFADSGGLPTGSALGTSDALTINTVVTQVAAAYGWVNFTFTAPVALSASTIYHLVIRTIGYTYNVGVTALYWGGDEGGTHTGDGETFDDGGGGWSAIAAATVLYFRIFPYNYLDATTIGVVSDAFTVMVEDPTTTSCKLKFIQQDLANDFAIGTRYGFLCGVFGDLA